MHAAAEMVNQSPSRSVDALAEHLRYLLLEGVCEGSPGATGKAYAAEVLRQQLRQPVQLSKPTEDPANCLEYSIIQAEVTTCLDVLHVKDLTLVPELIAGGTKLLIHVFD